MIFKTYKLQPKGECISVNSTHDAAAFHIYPYVALFADIWTRKRFMLIVCGYEHKPSRTVPRCRIIATTILFALQIKYV